MNVAIAFNNLYLNKDISDTQKELIYSLGEIVESRSPDTSYHNHRVSDYAELLCKKLGLPDVETELIKIATAMHDIGKIAIPDSILNKPCKLTEEEFEIIKTHTTLGYNLMKNTNRPIFRKAAEVALHHHERWDGMGYPDGLRGEAIPVEARIAAIADVFDALSSERIYRKPWNEDDTIAYIQSESGKSFDPLIVEKFLASKDQILTIKNRYI